LSEKVPGMSHSSATNSATALDLHAKHKVHA
jgi:hypothetical protein